MNTSKARKATFKIDPENPQWTKKDFAKAKPFADVFPHLAATIRRRGPQKKPTKTVVTIRLSPDVVAHYKATGRGWQSRIDEALRKAARLKVRA